MWIWCCWVCDSVLCISDNGESWRLRGRGVEWQEFNTKVQAKKETNWQLVLTLIAEGSLPDSHIINGMNENMNVMMHTLNT